MSVAYLKPVKDEPEKTIANLERELLEKASGEIKKLYLRIDFLRCQQENHTTKY